MLAGFCLGIVSFSEWVSDVTHGSWCGWGNYGTGVMHGGNSRIELMMLAMDGELRACCYVLFSCGRSQVC